MEKWPLDLATQRSSVTLIRVAETWKMRSLPGPMRQGAEWGWGVRERRFSKQWEMQGYEMGWLMSLQVIPADRRVKLASREEAGSMGKPSLGGGWGQPSGFRTRSLELGLTLTLNLTLTLTLALTDVIQDSRVRIPIQTGLSKKELFFSRDRSWLQIQDLVSLLVLLFSVLASLSGRLFSRRGQDGCLQV